MGYAFISYSTKNQDFADSMRQLLRQNGVSSWMAPMDIPVGSKYAQVITRAIKECACVVLLLSDASQNSTWVSKEIERAVNYRKIIIPVQLEDLVLNEEFEFYISTDQIIAVKQIDSSSSDVQKILSRLQAICADAAECDPCADTAECDPCAVAPVQQEPAADAPAGESQAYYEKGEVFWAEKQWDEAVKWYYKAAIMGHAEAQRSLGICYYEGGNGIEQDYAQSVKWLRKAAEQNDAVGQRILGRCYYKGQGVEQDYDQAVKWIRKAVEQNDSPAQELLGVCYYFGQGVEQNYARAVQWFRKSADQGDVDGQFCLGMCYYRGHGVEQNYEQAVPWLRKAAEQGYLDAQYWLGLCYLMGQGVEKNIAKAVEFYLKAAERGHVEAQLALAGYYAVSNPEEAKKWCRKAAEQGNDTAKTLFKVLYGNETT